MDGQTNSEPMASFVGDDHHTPRAMAPPVGRRITADAEWGLERCRALSLSAL